MTDHRKEWAEGLLRDATPGPWHPFFNVHGDPSVVVDLDRPSFTAIAKVHTSSDDYGRANAALIAAAPDLAAAVISLAGEVERLTEALELIASTDPVDAALDPDRAIRVAAAALSPHPSEPEA